MRQGSPPPPGVGDGPGKALRPVRVGGSGPGDRADDPFAEARIGDLLREPDRVIGVEDG